MSAGLGVSCRDQQTVMMAHKQKMTIAKDIHTTAIAAIGRLQRPMYHGPGFHQRRISGMIELERLDSP